MDCEDGIENQGGQLVSRELQQQRALALISSEHGTGSGGDTMNSTENTVHRITHEVSPQLFPNSLGMDIDVPLQPIGNSARERETRHLHSIQQEEDHPPLRLEGSSRECLITREKEGRAVFGRKGKEPATNDTSLISVPISEVSLLSLSVDKCPTERRKRISVVQQDCDSVSNPFQHLASALAQSAEQTTAVCFQVEQASEVGNKEYSRKAKRVRKNSRKLAQILAMPQLLAPELPDKGGEASGTPTTEVVMALAAGTDETSIATHQ